MKPTREQCLRWAEESRLIKREPAIGHVVGIENLTYHNIEALCHRAWNEAIETAKSCTYVAMGRDAEAIEAKIEELKL